VRQRDLPIKVAAGAIVFLLLFVGITILSFNSQLAAQSSKRTGQRVRHNATTADRDQERPRQEVPPAGAADDRR
jgi:hypothetical protein